MHKLKYPQHRFSWLRAAVVHFGFIVLALGIAFSLPAAAQFILYQWWPGVLADADLLLMTEICLAALLVLFFTAAKNFIEQRASLGWVRVASLVYARSHASWLSRWRERALIKQVPATRDAYVLSVTGRDVFSEHSRFRAALQSAGDLRVMLLNPNGLAAQQRVDSLLDEPCNPAQLREEIRLSIDYLQSLHQLGRKVSLKFYDQPPFWKLVILGEHVWVQYFHEGDNLPEYVFALSHKDPRHGLFMPFYMHFLEQWGEQEHPELDFDTGELVYRDAAGSEMRRKQFLIRPPASATQQTEAEPLLQAA